MKDETRENRDEQRGVRDVMEIEQTWDREGLAGWMEWKQTLLEIHQQSSI